MMEACSLVQAKLEPLHRIARMAMVNSRLPFMGFTDDHKFSRLGGRKADEAVKAPIATVLVGRLSAFKL